MNENKETLGKIETNSYSNILVLTEFIVIYTHILSILVLVINISKDDKVAACIHAFQFKSHRLIVV